MAMSPSSLLAKLDELKKWQQTQQERLMRQHHQRLEETDRGSSDYDSIPGLSAYNSYSRSNESNFYKNNSNVSKKDDLISNKSTEIERPNQVCQSESPNQTKFTKSYDYEKRNPVEKQSSLSNFSLESFSYQNKNTSKENKTPLDQNKNPTENIEIKAPNTVSFTNMPLHNKPPVVFETENSKSKRPFLKRGTGLGKFGMKPGDQKRPFNKMRPPETAVHKRLAALRREEAAKASNSQDVTDQERNKVQKTNHEQKGKTVKFESDNTKNIQKNDDNNKVSKSNKTYEDKVAKSTTKKYDKNKGVQMLNTAESNFRKCSDDDHYNDNCEFVKMNEDENKLNFPEKCLLTKNGASGDYHKDNSIKKYPSQFAKPDFIEDNFPIRKKPIDNNQDLIPPDIRNRCSSDEDFIEEDSTEKNHENFVIESRQGLENNSRSTDLYTIQEESSVNPTAKLNFDKYISSEVNECHKQITPLKAPEINVQSRAKWYSVGNNNALLEIPENNSLMECLKKLAAEKFGKNPDETAEIIRDFESLNLDETPDLHKKLVECLEQLIGGDNNSFAETNKKLVVECLEELVGNCSDGDTTSMRELQAFEQLEKRVMNSSFCSTNSSIFDLLSSTPFKKLVSEPKSVHFETVNPRRDSAKRELDFSGHQSDESTVTSEDFNERTLPRHDDFEETETTSSTSSSTIHERDVIVKQNACVMTDDLDFTASRVVEDEVFKKRLKELDLEISKFRAENAKLQKMKGEVENEKKELQKSRKKLEKENQDERIRMEFELEEEKKKLAKEKLVFEKYTKDLQNKPSKKEREEISSLKAELANVKETLKLKDTRNGTTQARLRTQLKSMEKENANLKEEIEKLQKQNAKLTAAQKVVRKTPSETKMLHEINKNLTKLTQDAKSVKEVVNKDDSFEEKKRRRKKKDRFETEYRRSFGRCSDEDESNSDEGDKSRMISDQSKRSPEFSRKRKSTEGYKRSESPNLYRNKSSSYDLSKRKSTEEPEIYRNSSNRKKSTEAVRGILIESPEINKNNSKSKSLSRQTSLESPESHRHKSKLYRSKSESYKNNSSESESCESDEITTNYSMKERRSYERRRDRDINKTINSTKNADITSGLLEKENNKNSTNFGDMTTFRNLSDLSIENNYDKVFGQPGDKLRNNSLNDTQGSTSGKIVSILEDGSKEMKYQNGNVKTISPDGNFIRMKYFNGDIKETKLLDGSIKYYYAQNELWHTTLANGDELFEFPDGQIEKRFIDGKSEITFPSGVLKTTYKDGKEKINYPDGSVVSIDGDEKVLLLPNGQKEIHTKEHKRREYPDGTVKILYPDGLQETRYSNGRIRMKDKDGNLLMDTHCDDM